MTDMQNQNVRLAVTFIIGFVVGFGVYWLWTHRATNDDMSMLSDSSSVNSTASTTSTTNGDASTNAFSVSDQAAGKVVVVSNVTLKAPGWVAIHDSVNGKPGKILGAVLVDKGNHTDVKVELLRSTVNGMSYVAMLHNDDGNYKNFNPQTDKPLLNADGTPITVSFTAGTKSSDTATTTSATTEINVGTKD